MQKPRDDYPGGLHTIYQAVLLDDELADDRDLEFGDDAATLGRGGQ